MFFYSKAFNPISFEDRCLCFREALKLRDIFFSLGVSSAASCLVSKVLNEQSNKKRLLSVLASGVSMQVAISGYSFYRFSNRLPHYLFDGELEVTYLFPSALDKGRRINLLGSHEKYLLFFLKNLRTSITNKSIHCKKNIILDFF